MFKRYDSNGTENENGEYVKYSDLQLVLNKPKKLGRPPIYTPEEQAEKRRVYMRNYMKNRYLENKIKKYLLSEETSELSLESVVES